MTKEKCTRTLDAEQLQELRDLLGPRRSVEVDDAVAAHVARLLHLSAIDAWLAELELAHGPIRAEALEWAARIVEHWESGRAQPPQTEGRRP